MKRGFTLLELIVVIIIIGILATLGVTQYTKVIEKGRTAEARMILGQIRTAQEAYKLESSTGSYATTLSALPVEAPANCAQTTHYFSYVTDATKGTATRCTGLTGKQPGGPSYTIDLTYATSAFTSTPAGY